MFEEVAGVPDAQLDVLREAERAAAVVFVRQCAALLTVWDATPDSTDGVGRRGHALAEIGLALGLHELTIGGRLAVAMMLQRFPLLAGLLTDGRLGVAHTLVTVAELEVLGEAMIPDPDAAGGQLLLAGRVLTGVLAAGGGVSGPLSKGVTSTLGRTGGSGRTCDDRPAG